ncbi:MAG: DUF2868 domain-containing protein [Myxococcota bacterium]
MDGSGLGQARGQGLVERVRGRAKTAELIGLVLALEERGELDERDRRRLDREIGARHGEATGLELLRAWLAKAPSEDLQLRAKRARSALSTAGWLVAAIGFVFGWGAAAALLAIEVYAGRINIVLCLGVLVLLPLLMLFGTGLGWIWSSLRRSAHSAGSGSLGDSIRSAGLGRLALRLIPAATRADVEVVLGRMTAHARLYGDVQRGQLLLWSQFGGLAFGLGALISTLMYVVFTDLAFGWSTTLDLEAQQVHRALSAFATPWAALWPDAHPSLELVEATRFFRVDAQNRVPVEDALRLGGWWPFLVMSIALYVVVPRALAWVGVRRWLAGEVGEAMGLTPGVERLMTRLKTPLVESTADEEEGEVGHAADGLVPEVEIRSWLAEAGGAALVVRWAELADAGALRAAIGLPESSAIREAGGRRSLAEDSAIVDECAAASDPVVLCVRGYEPPVLELTDFLAELREAIGRARRVCVMLVGGSEADRDTWRRKLLGLGDVALSVASVELGGEHV